MAYRRRPSWEDHATAGTVGCVLGLLLGAAVVLWHAFRPRPLPYRPMSPTNPQELLDSQERGRVYAYAIACVLSGIAFFASSQSSVAVIYGLFAAACGAATLYYGQRAFTPADTTVTRFDAPSSQKAVAFSIYPTPTKPDYMTGTRLIQSLLAALPRLTFQIVSTTQGMVWRVVDPYGTTSPQVIVDHIRSHGDGITAVVEPPGNQVASTARFPFYRQLMFFSLVNEYAAPLPFLEMLKSYDPLPAITNRMAFVQREKDERIIYSLVVLAASPQAKTNAARRIKEGMIRPLTTLTQDAKGNEIVLDEKVLGAKLTRMLYHAYLTVTVESQDRARLPELSAIAAEVYHYDLAGFNRLQQQWTSPVYAVVDTADDKKYTPLTQLATWTTQPDGEWRNSLLVLSPDELASLWHLPNELFTAPSIAWAGPTVPEEVTKTQGEQVTIGDAVAYGRRTPVHISLADRAYHAYVTGKTGMGKSTLLHTLIHQDIQAGRGVVVIDPHGKLVQSILATSVPRQRLNDVVLLECGNPDYPIPLNPFRKPSGVSYDTVFNYLYWTMRKIYEGIWREGRMDITMRNVLHALLCDPEATPLDISRLFTDADYRQYLRTVLAAHEHGSLAVELFWREFATKSKGDQEQYAAPILNRTGAFLGSRHLEHMTCHPQTLNFQEFMQARKIILIDLSGDRVRSEVGSLGAIFLANIAIASESLGYLPDNALPRCYVYVDEVEQIFSGPIADMFAHERKFGVSLTLANQFLDQLDRDTLQGILGNVGTKFIFECGEKDARTLESSTEPEIPGETLMNLGAYHMAVKTRFQGRSLPAFVVATRPILTLQTEQANPDEVRRRSRANVGLMDIASVRDWLTRRYRPPEQETSRKKRSTKEKTNDGLGDYE